MQVDLGELTLEMYSSYSVHSLSIIMPPPIGQGGIKR